MFLCSLACLGLLFQKQPGETQGDQGRALRENAALAARWQAGNAELGLATSCTVDHSVRSVVPVRLRAHLAERAASGITHHAAPRADESRSFWILDLPLPVQVDGRRHRCQNFTLNNFIESKPHNWAGDDGSHHIQNMKHPIRKPGTVLDLI